MTHRMSTSNQLAAEICSDKMMNYTNETKSTPLFVYHLEIEFLQIIHQLNFNFKVLVSNSNHWCSSKHTIYDKLRCTCLSVAMARRLLQNILLLTYSPPSIFCPIISIFPSNHGWSVLSKIMETQQGSKRLDTYFFYTATDFA